ncbi:dapper homolog 3-like isoform X1 [Anarrhichthys ocellatus]|uniref:dapper homolog 3-like isoform X1 n=1 Tax=Anarrhichthys ocellatus TaxID=433405 RepID=UPI0012EDB5D8|nr:dapper homolog 3-like isoform X1 [Anarrhichthys ocellatus]
MFLAYSLPMKAKRRRNKERLEASFAGLCELELLKQRQECRVLSALCLGDSPVAGRPPWGALRCALDAPNANASDDYSRRLQTSSPKCMPCAMKASLEQQVAELKVNTEVQSTDSPTDLEDCKIISGEVLAAKNGSPESNYQPLVHSSLSASDGTGETKTGETDLPRGATVTGALAEMEDVVPSQEDSQQTHKVKTYIFRLIQRQALPTHSSKLRTSLAHDARAVNVVRQSSICRMVKQHSPKQVSVQEISTPSQGSQGTAPQACHKLDQDPYMGTGFTEDVPPLYHQNLQQSIQHQPGLYHRPRQASMINTSRSTLLDYPSCRGLQAHPDSCNGELDSPQHFHNYPSSPGLSKPHQPLSPEEQLFKAEYIPAHPCRALTRVYAHHHSNPYKGPGVPNRTTYSPERNHHQQEQQSTASQIQSSRSRGGPKKCHSNEDRNGFSRKPGKKACRSQSENSLQRVPDRKYNTVERDGGGSGSGSRSSQYKSKKQQHGSCRRWQSTLELSQDETDQPPVQTHVRGSAASNQRDHCTTRTCKSRPTHVSHADPHHNHSHHHQHFEYQLKREQVPLCQPSEEYPKLRQGESESSMSEADSLESSSLSSDSDESGGLVWPPQLSLPSPSAPPGPPLQPKAFVKIKASHALKKKILRFRTGSLKVMTTV